MGSWTSDSMIVDVGGIYVLVWIVECERGVNVGVSIGVSLGIGGLVIGLNWGLLLLVACLRLLADLRNHSVGSNQQAKYEKVEDGSFVIETESFQLLHIQTAFVCAWYHHIAILLNQGIISSQIKRSPHPHPRPIM